MLIEYQSKGYQKPVTAVNTSYRHNLQTECGCKSKVYSEATRADQQQSCCSVMSVPCLICT